jgi:hypothetical protein
MNKRYKVTFKDGTRITVSASSEEAAKDKAEGMYGVEVERVKER